MPANHNRVLCRTDDKLKNNSAVPHMPIKIARLIHIDGFKCHYKRVKLIFKQYIIPAELFLQSRS